ncbi:M56 family metallopeptidase [Paenibacillus sp. FSL L8-0463]|uniref:M56 family metallopeptidase n=1 Tax=Paenibacillus sp. FSL L8-0463 TaxID=2954687 RepID=UPI003119D050
MSWLMDVFQMSLTAAVLIIAIVVVRALTLHKLPKKTFLVLWGVVLCRLLIPFSIPSTFSFYTGLDRLERVLKTTSSTPPPAEATRILHNVNFSGTAESIGNVASSVPASAPAPASIPLLAVIGLLGMCAFALFFIVTYIKCRREFQTSLPVENDFAARWLQEHPLRRQVQIRQSDKIKAPLTYGVFQPVILMPKDMDWTDETRLRYIFTHEFVHIRRFDALTKLVLTFALCLHWFNPMVWVMYILVNRDIELSCDETVVRTFGEPIKAAYAMTLIGMEEKKSKATPLFNSFSKNSIEERIIAIMKMKKTTVFGSAAALLLIAGTVTAFATSAAKPVSGSGFEENSMAVYEPYGLVYDAKSHELMYQNEEVRDFFDEQAGVGQSMMDGTVDVYAVYKNGKLAGIKKRSTEEFSKTTAEKEALQKEFAEKRKELGIADNEDFAYSDDSEGQAGAAGQSSGTAYSYSDETGAVQISTDDGKTWTSEEAYEQANPQPKVVWWTYEEYKAWLAEEKKALKSIIGGKGWNPTDGWYEWTPEKVNKAIAMYEGILEDIKKGVKVSKSVDGKDDMILSYNPGEIEVSTAHEMTISDDNGNTSDIGPYDTKEELLAAIKLYCERQVKAGKLTQMEAEKLISEATAQQQ